MRREKQRETYLTSSSEWIVELIKGDGIGFLEIEKTVSCGEPLSSRSPKDTAHKSW